MAKLKLAITSSKVLKSGDCMIHIIISARNKSLRFPTEIKVRPEHWKEGKVIGGRKGDEYAEIKNMNLQQVLGECQRKIINNAEVVKTMDAFALRKYLFNSGDQVSRDFFEYTTQRKQYYASLGKKKMALMFGSMVSKVREYTAKPTIDLEEINVKFLEMFEHYCLTTPNKRGNVMVPNGVATYMRYLRIILNDAVDDKLIKDYPFRKFKIKTEKTKNRNLSVEVIRNIRDYQTQNKREQIARDIFILQMYLFGINIIDLFYLTHSNIVQGRLQYSRTKTARELNILLEPEAKRLLEAYKGKKHLLWFADNSLNEKNKGHRPHTRATEYQWADQESFNRMINENLQKIQKSLNLSLPIPMTSYASRHSFATIMFEIGIEKDTISMCLSHSDPEQNLKTTGIYLNLDYAKCDKANRKLIDFINKDVVREIDYQI